MKRATKIIVGIIVIVILLSTFLYFWLFFNPYPDGDGNAEMYIGLDVDSTKRTITITSIENVHNILNWGDTELLEGNATLPAGTIDIGDIITNCSGKVTLLYKPQNFLICNIDFERARD